MTVQQSVQQSDGQNEQTAHWDDDGIDLRHYLQTLLSWWREILLITLLAALVSGVIYVILDNLEEPTFRASSSVIVARVTNNANFDDRFQTFSDETGGNAAINVSRRGALLGLVRTGAVAQAVVAELGDQLPPNLQEPAQLLEIIEAEVAPSADSRNPSDLIRIYATTKSPAMAAAIANSWSTHYVQQVNDLFGQVPPEVIASVEGELVLSNESYQQAQRALESFIASSQAQTLNRQIREKQTLIDAMQAGRQTALAAILDQDQAARLTLFTDLVDAQVNSAQAVLVEQVEEQLTQLSQLHALRNQTRRALDQANALLAQIQEGGDAAVASNALALQLLKTQIFASTISTLTDRDATNLTVDPTTGQPLAGTTGNISTNRQSTIVLPGNLQLAAGSSDARLTAQAQEADVTALVTALDQYIGQLNQEIDTLALALTGDGELAFLDKLSAQQLAISAPLEAAADATPTGTGADLGSAILRSYDELFGVGGLFLQSQRANPAEDATLLAIAQLETDTQQLRAQLEAEKSREQQLTQQRDLAWSTYNTLSNKVVELNLERTAANSEVRLGSPAITPTKPVEGQSLTVVVILAAILGFLLGVFIAILASALGKEPFLARRAAA